MNEKVSINAGDESTNISGKNVSITQNIYQGITEERANEIIDSKLERFKEIQLYTQESVNIAKERVEKLESIVVPRIEKIDKSLMTFTDPSFQAILSEAVNVAAQTDEIESYKLLSELLAYKAKKPTDKSVKMEVAYAINVVDKITDEALQALTLFTAIQTWFPTTGIISQGLKVLDNLYSSLIINQLPSNLDWIDQLDILKVIRIESLKSFYPFTQLRSNMLSGYAVLGIKKDSNNLHKAYELLASAGLSNRYLIENELDNEYLRLPLQNLDNCNTLDCLELPNQYHKLPPEKTVFIKDIIKLYDKSPEKKQKALTSLTDMWNSYPTLKLVSNWWDSLKISFSLTSIGKVLAITNAERIDPTLPKIAFH